MAKLLRGLSRHVVLTIAGCERCRRLRRARVLAFSMRAGCLPAFFQQASTHFKRKFGQFIAGKALPEIGMTLLFQFIPLGGFVPVP